MFKCRTAQWAQGWPCPGMGAGGWHWNQVENKLSNTVWSIRKQTLFISTGCIKGSAVCGVNFQRGIYSIRIMDIHSKVFPSSYLNKAWSRVWNSRGDGGEKVWHTAGWGSGCSPHPTGHTDPKNTDSTGRGYPKTPPVSQGELQNTGPTNFYSKAQITEPRAFVLGPCSLGCLNGDIKKKKPNQPGMLWLTTWLTGSKASSFCVQHWLSNRGIIIIERYN